RSVWRSYSSCWLWPRWYCEWRHCEHERRRASRSGLALRSTRRQKSRKWKLESRKPNPRNAQRRTSNVEFRHARGRLLHELWSERILIGHNLKLPTITELRRFHSPAPTQKTLQ